MKGPNPVVAVIDFIVCAAIAICAFIASLAYGICYEQYDTATMYAIVAIIALFVSEFCELKMRG